MLLVRILTAIQTANGYLLDEVILLGKLFIKIYLKDLSMLVFNGHIQKVMLASHFLQLLTLEDRPWDVECVHFRRQTLGYRECTLQKTDPGMYSTDSRCEWNIYRTINIRKLGDFEHLVLISYGNKAGLISYVAFCFCPANIDSYFSNNN